MKKLIKLTMITVCLCVSSSLLAISFDGTWALTGAVADGYWTNSANWVSGIIPGPGMNAYFTNSTIDDKITVNLSDNQNISVAGIYLNSTRVQLPNPASAGGIGTNITLNAGGGTPIIDVSSNRLDCQVVLEGTEGFTLNSQPGGILMIGATAKPISGPVLLQDVLEVIYNHKDSLMNADVTIQNTTVRARQYGMTTKSLNINNAGFLNLTERPTEEITGSPINVNAGGTLKLLTHAVVSGSNIVVNAGGEFRIDAAAGTSVIENDMSLAGNGITASLGAFHTSGAGPIVTNNGLITLNGSTRIGQWGGGTGTMIMNGGISGTGPCVLLAQGGDSTHIRTFELHAANNYTGNTSLEGFACQNVTRLYGNQRLPHTDLTLWIHNWANDTASTFDLNGYTQTVTALTVGAGAGGDLITLTGGGQLRSTSNNVNIINGNFDVKDVSLIADKYILVRSGNIMTVSNAYIYCGLELMPGIAASPGTVILDNGAEANVFVTRVGIDPSVEANDVGTYYLKSGSILKTAAAQNSGGGASGLGSGSAIYYDGGTLSDGVWNDWNASYTDWIKAGFSNVVQTGGAKIEVNNVNNRIVNVPFLHDPALGGTLDGGLTKLGPQVLTLNGVNDYTGPTTVSSGTLIINTMGASKALVVADGATIGDTSGTLTIPAGATVSPGSSIGTMNSGSLIMDTGSEYDWEVGDPVSADLIDVAGTFTISAGGLTVNVIGAGSPGGTYALVQTTGGIIGDANEITMNYTGGLSGSAAYISGNDLLADVIPEPATFGLLAILGLAFLRRK